MTGMNLASAQASLLTATHPTTRHHRPTTDPAVKGNLDGRELRMERGEKASGTPSNAAVITPPPDTTCHAGDKAFTQRKIQDVSEQSPNKLTSILTTLNAAQEWGYKVIANEQHELKLGDRVSKWRALLDRLFAVFELGQEQKRERERIGKVYDALQSVAKGDIETLHTNDASPDTKRMFSEALERVDTLFAKERKQGRLLPAQQIAQKFMENIQPALNRHNEDSQSALAYQWFKNETPAGDAAELLACVTNNKPGAAASLQKLELLLSALKARTTRMTADFALFPDRLDARCEEARNHYEAQQRMQSSIDAAVKAGGRK